MVGYDLHERRRQVRRQGLFKFDGWPYRGIFPSVS